MSPEFTPEGDEQIPQETLSFVIDVLSGKKVSPESIPLDQVFFILHKIAHACNVTLKGYYEKLSSEKVLTKEQQEEMFLLLETRFYDHPDAGSIEWGAVEDALLADPEGLYYIYLLEKTGGMVKIYHTDEEGFDVGDGYKEVACGRRNLVYDEQAERQVLKRGDAIDLNLNAVAMAEELGVDIMSAEQYTKLQTLGEFDTAGCTLLKTDEETRREGKVLHGYRDEYGKVEIYEIPETDHDQYSGFRGTKRFEWV